MMMSLNDLGAIGIDDAGLLRVASRSGSVGMRWPGIVQYRSKFYQFNANEAMDSEFLNNYGGHASYQEISEKEALAIDRSPLRV